MGADEKETNRLAQLEFEVGALFGRVRSDLGIPGIDDSLVALLVAMLPRPELLAAAARGFYESGRHAEQEELMKLVSDAEERANYLASELELARQPLRKIRDAWARYKGSDLNREEFDGTVAEVAEAYVGELAQSADLVAPGDRMQKTNGSVPRTSNKCLAAVDWSKVPVELAESLHRDLVTVCRRQPGRCFCGAHLSQVITDTKASP